MALVTGSVYGTEEERERSRVSMQSVYTSTQIYQPSLPRHVTHQPIRSFRCVAQIYPDDGREPLQGSSPSNRTSYVLRGWSLACRDARNKARKTRRYTNGGIDKQSENTNEECGVYPSIPHRLWDAVRPKIKLLPPHVVRKKKENLKSMIRGCSLNGGKRLSMLPSGRSIAFWQNGIPSAGPVQRHDVRRRPPEPAGSQ